MREALCTQLHINFFDLDRAPLDPALGRLITEKYATKRRIVPLFRSGQLLVVAVDDPTDMAVVEDLQQMLRLRVEIVTSTTAKILRAITRLYSTDPRPAVDPCLHHNIMIGNVHDQEVADLAVKVLKVRILPPYWQASGS
jgi:type II secretory ATPase GspE/PulE/Tfp pilus assembly ATPase PilB-like protein